jgi:hypothetical protein
MKFGIDGILLVATLTPYYLQLLLTKWWKGESICGNDNLFTVPE